jgi:hypothetical protein
MATENKREKSTVLLGDLYSVRMKLVQSEIQTARERFGDPENSRDERPVREADNRKRFARQMSLGSSMCELL